MTDQSSTPTAALETPRIDSMRLRELQIARELAHAFLNAGQPVEVYRLALDRVTPLVQANFSSVFLRDPADADLLKLACAHNWPQTSARYLGQLRVRVGRGPTGRAVAEGTAIEVENVFSDPSLREWWEPARELGFASLSSLPLTVRGEVAGALTFYFSEPHRFQTAERQLLALIADQLAATAEKAHLIENLQSANARLRRQNEELVRKVREARVSRQLKNEFLANISHELRTPLTSIMGYAYLLQGGHTGELSERQSEAVEKIDRAAGILLKLIGDLLELSQLKLARIELHPGSEDASELARRAIAEAGAPQDGVAFEVDLQEGGLRIETDGRKVAKILEKLLSNAFKFTAEGRVRFSARMLDAPERARSGVGRFRHEGASHGEPGPSGAPEAHWLEWVVEDTGIGIDPSQLESIFDEFRQVDGSSTRLYGGTGLGLALSLRLARLLGGDITVESQPGRGARFALRLPVAWSPGPRAETSEEE